MDEKLEELNIEVAYARSDVQECRALKVQRGLTLRAAIERSKIMESFPEIDLAVNEIGVYGEVRDPGDTVRNGDRIEIYRPLLIDPREARRRNAEATRKNRRDS